MKRLKYLFAGALLLIALPVWRYLDMMTIIAPMQLPFMLWSILWFAIFLLVPLKLIYPQLKTLYALCLIVLFGMIAWWSGPLSRMATTDPTFNHCGFLTYTGAVYPTRSLLTDAHRDDLEVRNQLCWIRKMTLRVPTTFGSEHEADTYNRIIEKRLMAPDIKYRVSVPLIIYLQLKIYSSAGNFYAAKNVIGASQFWSAHYTEEIHERNYPLWNWPHSEYIKFEYGLLEKNWQQLVDGLIIN